jgi:hypothetical protein
VKYPRSWRAQSCRQCDDPTEPNAFLALSDPSGSQTIMIERLADKPEDKAAEVWLHEVARDTVLSPIQKERWITVSGSKALKIVNERSENIYVTKGSLTVAIRYDRAVRSATQIISTFKFDQSSQPDQHEAVDTVNRYVQLRVAAAPWASFATLIAWEDEPGWDCNWLVNGYSVRKAEKRGGTVIVPVTYHRIGFYCHDFDFKRENRNVTLRYEVVKSPTGWTINAPEPDPPDLSVDVQIEALRDIARNSHETAEHRNRAEATLQLLSEFTRPEQ